MPRASGSICFSPPIRRRPRLRLSTAAIGQMNDKEDFAFFAEGLLPLGIDLAVIENALAPVVPLDHIVAQVRRSVRWLPGHLAEYGAPPTPLYVAGHAAGGHLD